MARIKMVTRTIEGLKVSALCVDLKTKELKTVDFHVPKLADADKVLKYLQKHEDSDTQKTVSIASMSEDNQCYGMLESEFLKYAKPVDEKTRKIIESQSEEETASADETPLSK